MHRVNAPYFGYFEAKRTFLGEIGIFGEILKNKRKYVKNKREYVKINDNT